MKTLSIATLLLTTASLTTAAQGALLHEYNFDQGTAEDSVGGLHLNSVGSGAVYTSGFAVLDGSVSNYLEVNPAYGSTPFSAFTMSLWVRANVTDQGGFQGIFTNDTSSNAANSWQIDNHNGQYRLTSDSGGSVTSSVAPRPGAWDNLVVRKVSSTQAELWVNGMQAATSASNVGDLNALRLGINRNSNNSYMASYDHLQVWDTAENPAAIYAAGHQTTSSAPTPSNSWIAGAGADSDGGSNGLWEPFIGSTPWTFNDTPPLVAVNDAYVTGIDHAYTASARIPGASNPEMLFSTTDSGTLELWFKPTDLVGTHVLFETGGNGSGTVLALVDGQLQMVAQQDSLTQLTTSADLSSLEWTQIVAVISNPLDGSGSLTLYLNGQLIDFDSLPVGSGFNRWGGDNGAGLGRITGVVATDLAGVTDFDGQMAVFNHYRRALNAQEVRTLHRSMVAPEPSSQVIMFGSLASFLGFALIRRRR